jgi:hypothetical protein
MALVGVLALSLRWKLKKENLKLESGQTYEDEEEDVELLAEGQERWPTRKFTYLL